MKRVIVIRRELSEIKTFSFISWKIGYKFLGIIIFFKIYLLIAFIHIDFAILPIFLYKLGVLIF